MTDGKYDPRLLPLIMSEDHLLKLHTVVKLRNALPFTYLQKKQALEVHVHQPVFITEPLVKSQIHGLVPPQVLHALMYLYTYISTHIANQ